MSAREIVALFFREIWLVMLVMIVPVLAALALFAVTPKSYEASAKILVSGQDAAQSSPLPQSNADGTQSTSQEVLNSEVEFLTSRELADRTIAAVGARRLFPHLPLNRSTGLPDPDALSAAFAKALSVRAVAASHVIDVSLKGPDTRTATEALADYLNLYQDIHKEAYARPVAGLLSQQLKGYEQSLQKVESQITAFKEKSHIFDPDLERKELLDTRNSLYATAMQLRNQVDELKTRVRTLEAQRAKTPDQLPAFPESSESDAMQKARSQLLELRQQQIKLGENYQPSSRAMQDVQTQIDGVQTLLSAETRRFAAQRRPTRNPLFDELTAEIARATVQIAPDEDRARAIDGQLAAIDQRLGELAEGEKTLDPLLRQRAEGATTVEAFRQREAEAKLGEYLERQKIANIHVIQGAEPTTVNRPTGPKLLTFVAGGPAAGLLLAGVLLGAAFARKNTFLVPESVEARTKIPVLVSLPVRAA